MAKGDPAPFPQVGSAWTLDWADWHGQQREARKWCKKLSLQDRNQFRVRFTLLSQGQKSAIRSFVHRNAPNPYQQSEFWTGGNWRAGTFLNKDTWWVTNFWKSGHGGASTPDDIDRVTRIREEHLGRRP